MKETKSGREEKDEYASFLLQRHDLDDLLLSTEERASRRGGDKGMVLIDFISMVVQIPNNGEIRG